MSYLEQEELLGDRHKPEEEVKKCMFQSAKQLGFSTQEIGHLKRLYADEPEMKKSDK